MTTTPNMSIFIPSSGQELYSPSFTAGMLNVDQHDHSGAPDNGIPIGTNGIQDGAVTPAKLSFTLYNTETVQTTDATPTNIAVIPMDEGQIVTVEGLIIGLRDTTAEGIGGRFMAVFRRPTAGNVTLIGTATIEVEEDFTGAPTFDVVANVGTQTIDIQVTGEAAKTIDWETQYQYITNT